MWFCLLFLSLLEGETCTKWQVTSQNFNCTPICVICWSFSVACSEFSKLTQQEAFWIYTNSSESFFIVPPDVRDKVIFTQPFTWKKSWYKFSCLTFFESVICVLYIASEEFHYFPSADLIMISFYLHVALKKDPFQFLLNSQEWLVKKMNSVANRGLRIGGAHNRSMESCAWKQFFRPNIESSIKVCHTKLVWIGTSAGLMTRRCFGDRRKKLIGIKEVERFVRHR